MSKALFIGGPNDGRRMFLPLYHEPVIHVPVLQHAHESYPDCTTDSLTKYVNMNTYTYNLHRFGPITVAVASNVTDVMAQLVKGYRYHRNARRR